LITLQNEIQLLLNYIKHKLAIILKANPSTELLLQ